MVFKDIDITVLVVGGTLLMLLFVGFLIMFVIAYRQRSVKIHLWHQKELLLAQVQSEEKERARIAKELHDGVGVSVSSIGYFIKGIEGNLKKNKDPQQFINTGIQVVEATAEDIRRLSHNMLPASLEKFGLQKTINELVNRLNASGKVNIEFKSSNSIVLPKDVELHLYRIVQEVVNNALRHSQTERIKIEMGQTAGMLHIKIMDMGKGFDYAKATAGKSFGLKNIEARAQLINARYLFKAGDGKGTVFELTKKLS